MGNILWNLMVVKLTGGGKTGWEALFGKRPSKKGKNASREGGGVVTWVSAGEKSGSQGETRPKKVYPKNLTGREKRNWEGRLEGRL